MTRSPARTPLRWTLVGLLGSAVLSTSALTAAPAGAVPAKPASHASAGHRLHPDQFRGVNWADPRDNFADDEVVPSGLSTSDSYATTYAKATDITRDFRRKVGANTLRLPINPYSVGNDWWRSYRGAIDAATDHGFKVILSYWEGTGEDKEGTVDDPDAFWDMWATVVRAYRSDKRVYFEPMNEPHGYAEADWIDLAAQWLDTFPSVPRNRVFVSGSGYSDHVGGVCADPRLDGTYLALHNYAFWGQRTYEQWLADFQERIGGCADRTVLDELGVAMTTGIDYDDPRPTGNAETDNFVAFLRAATETVDELDMGAVYWPGLRTGDTYSLTTLRGEGTDLSLTVNNPSGLELVQQAWGRHSHRR